MEYPPCLNPNCKSHGQSHPNCRCHPPDKTAGQMAEGGSVDGFCANGLPHDLDCEYFVDGGSVGDDNPAGLPLDNQSSANEAQYGGIGNEALAAGESLANTVTLGGYQVASRAADKALGLDPTYSEKVAEQNPTAHLIGQIGGLLSGEGAVAGAKKAGEALESQIGGGLATKLGLENALFTLSDEVAKHVQSNPDSIQTAAMHVGLSGLIGGLGGKVIGQVGELGKGAEQAVKEFTDTLKANTEDVTPQFRKGPFPNFPPPPGSSLFEDVPESSVKPQGQRVADFMMNQINKAAVKAVGGGLGAAMGHLTGVPGMGTMGAMFGASMLKPIVSTVMPTLIKPLIGTISSAEGLKAASDAIMSVAKGENLATNAAKGLFEAGTNKVLQGIRPEQDKLDKLDERVEELNNAPEAMLGIGGSLGHYLPAHNTALAATAQNAVNYLSSQKPRNAQPGMLDRPIDPPSAAEASYNRTLGIAQQPLMVLRYLKDGSLTAKDVSDLRTLYPAVHMQLTNIVGKHMIDHLSKEGHIPYKYRMGLSHLLGQPVDSTFSPVGIQAAQATFALQGPQLPQGKASAKKGTAKVGKQAENAQTPQETRNKALSKA